MDERFDRGGSVTVAADVSWRVVAAGLLLLLALFGPALIAHVRLAADPLLFNDDVRQQIWPLYRLTDQRLFAGDLLADYYLDCTPLGFRALYGMLSPVVKPALLSRILPYVLLLVTLTALGAAAFGAAGRFGVLMTLAFALGSAAMLDRMTGGLPRAFGFPLLALLVLFVVQTRPVAAAVVVASSAAFYPPAALVGGVVLLVWLALPKIFSPALALRPVGRLTLLVTAAAAAAAVHAPVSTACAAYGPSLTAADSSRFPEMGTQGRYLPEDRPPFRAPVRSVLATTSAGLLARSELLPREFAFAWPVLSVLAAVAFAGAALAAVSSHPVRRLWLFPAGAVISYAVAAAVYPQLYIPTRYPTLVMPLLAPLGMAVGLRWAASRVAPAGRARVALIAGGVLMLTAALLAPAPPVATAGWSTRVSPRDAALYSFLADLPHDAVVAGWPGPNELIEAVPYLALRRALVTWETHQVFHERYVLEMRRRMEPLLGLYIDGDAGAVRTLRDEFGVTHLIVMKDPRWYGQRFSMEPFATHIRERSGGVSRERVWAALQGRPVVYENAHAAVVDLR